jgi:hypothetical protein
MKDPIDLLVWFYSQRGGAENLIKEANNDEGPAAHPSGRWMINCNHFQVAMLAYNLNCWLMLFNREEEAKVETLKHATLATARLRFLFLAAKIWPRGRSRCQLKRPLHRAGNLLPADGSTAGDSARRIGPGAGDGTDSMNEGCIEFYARPTKKIQRNRRRLARSPRRARNSGEQKPN